MTKQEFLAASLPYGLETMFNDTVVRLTLTNVYSAVNNTQVIPIIRHLDTLTQECVEADYNDGKPFVPIVELAKIAGCDTSNYKRLYSNRTECKVYLNDELEFYYQLPNDSFRYFDSEDYGFLCVNNQFEIYKHMIKWHFWPNKPDGEEVVYVSDDFNPYK